ncbi:MAG: 3-oxoacyl-ACP reductase [Leptospiraceae bacterium]|nr:MAG: 3-oxoacyl-ACP reductase [Leptospiraceae bacterium]
MNILITGACGGLGKELIKKLSTDKKNFIIATDIFEQNDFKSENIIYYQLDVSKYEEWEFLIQKIEAKYPIDVLINLAGIIIPSYITNYKKEDIDKQIDINCKGIIYGSTIIVKYMKERKKGHIINVSSLAGVAPIPGISLYSTSKFAVRGFSLAIAQELKPYNINVSVICPDAIKTPMLDLQKDYKEAALTFSNFRYLTPEEVSDIIIKKAIKKKKLEILIPWYRGILAKISNLFPSLINFLLPILNKIGEYNQKKYKV